MNELEASNSHTPEGCRLTRINVSEQVPPHLDLVDHAGSESGGKVYDGEPGFLVRSPPAQMQCAIPERHFNPDGIQ